VDGPANESGDGLYSLMGVVSHLGRSADHGHYVCHLRKSRDDVRGWVVGGGHGDTALSSEGGPVWVLYNDDKVTFHCVCVSAFREPNRQNTWTHIA